MTQKPHASSVSRGKRKPKTDSKGRAENELTLFSATSPMVSSARETDGRQTQNLREKSEKKEVRCFREMVAQVGMRLDY